MRPKKNFRGMLLIVILGIVTLLTGCSKDCSTGCGEKANPKCAAEMCDSCCSYWKPLNGCFGEH